MALRASDIHMNRDDLLMEFRTQSFTYRNHIMQTCQSTKSTNDMLNQKKQILKDSTFCI